MGINSNKTEIWKEDTMKSVDYYNHWFMNFAPQAFREARNGVIAKVKSAMKISHGFRDISAELLCANPEILSTLRMATAPPLAVDRLAGLASAQRSLVKSMEAGKARRIDGEQAGRMAAVIAKMIDHDIMTWIKAEAEPKRSEALRAASIIADRLTGSLADPIIRNEQEKRQLRAIANFLDARGYRQLEPHEVGDFRQMQPKTYTFHLSIPVTTPDGRSVNIPPDVVVKNDRESSLPLLIECKSAGDFANTNKRRKEEAQKLAQLHATYGKEINYILFLCGYFDTSYLGYEAAEGIDWIWEHKMEDMEKALAL